MSLKVVLQFERCDFEELKECFSKSTLDECIDGFVLQMGRLGIEVVTEHDVKELTPELTLCDESDDEEDTNASGVKSFLTFRKPRKPLVKTGVSHSLSVAISPNKGKPIGSVVLHTGYTKKGSNDMLDLLTGDTSTFEATLRQIGFNGKGTYGGVPGSWFISSTHRSKALDAFITNNIECQTQKWMAKKPAAPKEEKGKEKEESFIPSPFSVSNSTTPPGPTI